MSDGTAAVSFMQTISERPILMAGLALGHPLLPMRALLLHQKKAETMFKLREPGHCCGRLGTKDDSQLQGLSELKMAIPHLKSGSAHRATAEENWRRNRKRPTRSRSPISWCGLGQPIPRDGFTHVQQQPHRQALDDAGREVGAVRLIYTMTTQLQHNQQSLFTIFWWIPWTLFFSLLHFRRVALVW